MKKGEKMSDEQKAKLSKVHKGKVFSPEHIENLRKSHLGQIPTNLEQLRTYRKGRPLTDEHKRNLSKSQKGKPKNFSEDGKKRMREASLGRPAWNKGMTGIMNGDKNPNWIADRSKVKKYKKRLGSLYTQWRRACHLRDEYTCQLKDDNCCGRLEVHHIKRWIDDDTLRYEVSNGITLCHYHHPRKRADEEKLASQFTTIIKSKV
jgi:hypothetical protein